MGPNHALSLKNEHSLVILNEVLILDLIYQAFLHGLLKVGDRTLCVLASVQHSSPGRGKPALCLGKERRKALENLDSGDIHSEIF